MKQCQHCLVELAEKAKLCPECGTPVPQPVVVVESKIEQLPTIMTAIEVSKFLKISSWKFYDAVKKGQAPPYFTVGTHKRFITEKVLDWAANQQMQG